MRGRIFFCKINAIIKACSQERFFATMFFFFIDVKDWINNNCAECVLSHLNICDWFTRSHPSKGENRSEIAPCERTSRSVNIKVGIFAPPTMATPLNFLKVE